MPKVGKIERERSVRHGFIDLRRALLPTEIAENSLAQWVMKYDELLQRNIEQEFGNPDQERENQKIFIQETIGYFAGSILQSRIPFYFASLFHIGRQWKVLEGALQDCRLLQTEDNLRASARNLSEVSHRPSKFGRALNEEQARSYLQQFCEITIKKHEADMVLTKNWWETWKSEVSEYNRIVSQLEEALNSIERRRFASQLLVESMTRLMVCASKPSKLQTGMIRQGVRFKPETVETEYLPFQSILLYVPLFTLALLMSDLDNYPHHFFDHFEYSLRQFVWEIRNAPAVEHKLNTLKQKYGDTDPFIGYKAGQKAATLTLLQLIKEHTLPNDSDSGWLSKWKNSLEEEPYRWDEFSKADKTLEQIENWAILSADSTIKRNLANRQKPAEQWEEFIQRLFEEEWITPIKEMVKRRNETTKPHSEWTNEEFSKLIEAAVKALNRIGYSLRVPDLLTI